MAPYLAIIVLVLLIATVIAALYLLSIVLRPCRSSITPAAFLAGEDPREHAMSRFHVRWYLVALLFLAFDMEMVFMYPWAVVFADIGMMALIEMGMFLLILSIGILYAWREGALKWT